MEATTEMPRDVILGLEVDRLTRELDLVHKQNMNQAATISQLRLELKQSENKAAVICTEDRQETIEELGLLRQTVKELNDGYRQLQIDYKFTFRAFRALEIMVHQLDGRVSNQYDD